MAEAPLRVVIADDSPTVRLALRQTLSAERGFAIVGEAADGRRAVDLVLDLVPDIVVMDVDMPVMDGIEATRRIMRTLPVPILIFTSSTIAGRSRVAVEALAAGALEIMAKPGVLSELESGAGAEALRKTLRLLAPIKVIRRHGPREPMTFDAAPAVLPKVLAVGASTGGPAALVETLRPLAPGIPTGVVLVQHMSAEFMPGFVEWLGANIQLPVKAAAAGDRLRPGVVLVAPGDWHMRLSPEGAIGLDKAAPLHSCRPAVDALFESVAVACGPAAMGVLLTGMGADGAAGLLAMRRRGAVTIAQDEATSVVFGMPKAAIALGAAQHVLGLPAIGRFLAQAAGQGVSG